MLILIYAGVAIIMALLALPAGCGMAVWLYKRCVYDFLVGVCAALAALLFTIAWQIWRLSDVQEVHFLETASLFLQHPLLLLYCAAACLCTGLTAQHINYCAKEASRYCVVASVFGLMMLIQIGRVGEI